MIGAVPLARRNLTRQRLRFALSAAGVGLALLLILSLEAIYSGVLRKVTAYPDNAGAPLIVSQRGVETMHMSSSSLPLGVVRRLREDPRVARAAPILYSPIILNGHESVSSYLIGFRRAGGPWEMVEGRSRPPSDGIVIDEITAEPLGVGIGDRLRVAATRLRIVGLARGTFSIISSVSFIDYATFERLEGAAGSASYVLVWPRPAARRRRSPRALNADYPVTAQTSDDFSGPRAPGRLRHEHGADPRPGLDRLRGRRRRRRPQHLHGNRRPPARVCGAEGDRDAEQEPLRDDLAPGPADRGDRVPRRAGPARAAERRWSAGSDPSISMLLTSGHPVQGERWRPPRSRRCRAAACAPGGAQSTRPAPTGARWPGVLDNRERSRCAPDAARSVLDAKALRRRFGTGEAAVEAVRGIDLELGRGEIVLIMGPSGSGKTTLLSMLGGLLRPTSRARSRSAACASPT